MTKDVIRKIGPLDIHAWTGRLWRRNISGSAKGAWDGLDWLDWTGSQLCLPVCLYVCLQPVKVQCSVQMDENGI